MISATRTLYSIKPAFVGSLRPISDRLAAAGVRPNSVTLAALPVEFAVAASLVAGTFYPPVWLLVAPLALAWMGLNALDGALARATHSATASGAVLNELVDRSGDLLVLLVGFFVVPVPVAVAALVAVAGSEVVAAIGWAVTGTRDFPGPMGKPDRAAVLALGAAAAVVWAPALVLAYVCIAAGATVGMAGRIRHIMIAARLVDGAPS